MFIFGAGASASCGIAVARDILREAMKRLSEQDAEQADKVHALLSYFYPGFSEDLFNYPNVEDFLNLVQIATEFHSDLSMGTVSVSKLKEGMDITLRAIAKYIWAQMADETRRLIFETMIGKLIHARDVVITFNWDFLLDLALEKLPHAGPVYTYSDGSTVLLKPHGSIDWFETKTIAENNTRLKKEMRRRAEGVNWYPYYRPAHNPELLDQIPFIVPPLAVKKYPGFLKHVWRDVYRAIASASKLFVIGYSLPREDQFARLVIGRAIQRNNTARKDGKKLSVVVVNPDEGTMATFAKLVGSPVQFVQAPLQDYVRWLEPDE